MLMKNHSISYSGPFYQSKPVKFECTQCGKCCTGKGSYVFVTKSEAEKIQLFLGVSKAWFNRRYLLKHMDGDVVLTQHENGDCEFLDKIAGCRIYKVRPTQCSTYPYWPEIMKNRKSWLQERRRCEGIDRGEAVSVQKIHDALALLADNEA